MAHREAVGSGLTQSVLIILVITGPILFPWGLRVALRANLSCLDIAKLLHYVDTHVASIKLIEYPTGKGFPETPKTAYVLSLSWSPF
jgi:hypothetical protein